MFVHIGADMRECGRLTMKERKKRHKEIHGRGLKKETEKNQKDVSFLSRQEKFVNHERLCKPYKSAREMSNDQQEDGDVMTKRMTKG